MDALSLLQIEVERAWIPGRAKLFKEQLTGNAGYHTGYDLYAACKKADLEHHATVAYHQARVSLAAATLPKITAKQAVTAITADRTIQPNVV